VPRSLGAPALRLGTSYLKSTHHTQNKPATLVLNILGDTSSRSTNFFFSNPFVEENCSAEHKISQDDVQ